MLLFCCAIFVLGIGIKLFQLSPLNWENWEEEQDQKVLKDTPSEVLLEESCVVLTEYSSGKQIRSFLFAPAKILAPKKLRAAKNKYENKEAEVIELSQRMRKARPTLKGLGDSTALPAAAYREKTTVSEGAVELALQQLGVVCSCHSACKSNTSERQ